jgi:hypothetical protein
MFSFIILVFCSLSHYLSTCRPTGLSLDLKNPILFFLGEANTGVFKAYTKNHISMHLHGYGKVTPSDFSASFQGRRLKFGTLLHIME